MWNSRNELCRILKEIAEKRKEAVISVLCVTGIRNGKYTMFLCGSNALQGILVFDSSFIDMRRGFSLITSIHYYSVSPKSNVSISDGVGVHKSHEA